jgi:multidrug efflux pump subunit AcrA (membrane-fusion protein)
VSQVINADNRTFQVFIKPTKSKLTLSPNLLAIVSATDYAADSVLVVPTQIVKRDTENNPYVFIVTNQDNQNMIAKRMLTIQRFGADFSIVSDGLAPGDLLVTKGYNSIDVNDKVKVVN